ncbi:MAG: hypothetical protein KGM24_03445, partial [Elusimicrobia bacterium]|nr:hypothetical protein [Elusimicrobiota bacterium]
PAAAAPAARAAADWRRAGLSPDVQDSLRELGYRLEGDGRVLDPKTRAPLTEDQFREALRRLDLSARRLALERLSVLLDKKVPTAADRAEMKALEGDLPPDVVAALEGGRGAAELRALAGADLAQIAAYFDGSRTLADRLAAARPVVAGAPGPRVPLPYFTPDEQALGRALDAETARILAKDPYGRSLLADLSGPDGRPDLPPIVVEDLTGGTQALYEYRRGAIALDRQGVLDAVVGAQPPTARDALRAKLSDRTALIAYLDAHPAAVSAFVAQSDVALFHELVHAWQDRRDPLMREMARGDMPDAMILEYEEEAWTMKNRYLASKLKNEPGSVADDYQLDDLAAMTRDPRAWRRALYDQYQAYDPANALTLRQTADVEALRLQAARDRKVATSAEQRDKSLDLLALGRTAAELSRTQAAQAARLRADRAWADASAAADARLLALHYLSEADASADPVAASVDLSKADDDASLSGDKALLARVRAREAKP